MEVFAVRMDLSLFHRENNGIISALHCGEPYTGRAALQVIKEISFQKESVQFFLLKEDGAAQACFLSCSLFS